MTLLELLVAMAIFATLGAALFPTLSGVLEGRRRAEARLETDASARLLLDRLEQDLWSSVDSGFPGALPPRFVAAAAASTRAAARDRRLVELTTLVARGVTAPDGAAVGADLVPAAADRGDLAHVLWRIDATGRVLRHELRPPVPEQVDWSEVPAEVIAERADVALEFYEPTQWLAAWDSGEPGPRKGRAPMAVRLTVSVAGPDQALADLVSTVVLPTIASATQAGRPGRRP